MSANSKVIGLTYALTGTQTDTQADTQTDAETHRNDENITSTTFTGCNNK